MVILYLVADSPLLMDDAVERDPERPPPINIY
jgi:hypothetical protein